MRSRPALVSRCIVLCCIVFAALAPVRSADAPQTERRYLSGHGPKDAVPWNFKVTGGRRAGEETTIPVPSNWEQHGFGSYNYGQERSNRSNEHGLYSLRFTVPPDWRGRRVRLVFDGVMTDATVTVNGKSAGPVHQGAFYRFSYDITSLLKRGNEGDNLLEVDVAKVSADPMTETAERGGDYWIFGGIFRPVWLEALPPTAIDHVAIDARADGAFTADISLSRLPGGRNDSITTVTESVSAEVVDAKGQRLGEPITATLPMGGAGKIRLAGNFPSPRTWSAETPVLYTLRVTLLHGTEALHSYDQRFGFRTFEVRDGQGLFVNGQRVYMKGVDRHSFRPETGRALNREDCFEDVRVIRSMNMNAVRMSHYPPDEAFLEACDELGLYVLDELSGWQHTHSTPVGRLLIREMVERDVNHPAIVFWDNGNEGGFNRDFDGEFALYDPQQRRVLHPWDTFSGVDTKHYANYDDFVRRLHGPNVVMPTEILHAIYDGGAGAGLEDYWREVIASPVGGGLFIWDFADEGVVRTDQRGRIDVFSTFAPDGIIGPHFEKEGSYYAVRDIWCPVQIDAPLLDEKFGGSVTVHNRFDVLSLASCHFTWKLLREDFSGPTVITQGMATAPDLAPHADGQLALGLPSSWTEADEIALTATDARGDELWTWTWPTPALAHRTAARLTSQAAVAAPKIETPAGEIVLRAGETAAHFDATTGLLRSVSRGTKEFALKDGPRLAFARPPSAAKVEWLPLADAAGDALIRKLATPHVASAVEVEFENNKTIAYTAMKLEISPDGQTWKTVSDGSRRYSDGPRYDITPQLVAAVRISNIHTEHGLPNPPKAIRIGYAAGRFPDAITTAAAVTHGTERDGVTGGTAAWLEVRGGASGLEHARWTLRSDGSLRLDYSYDLEGEYVYHGITFAHAEDQMNSLRWLGEGPTRVWQNRLRGTTLGLHDTTRRDLQPGESWTYPEFDGYFAGVREARLTTAAGPLTVLSPDADTWFRVGTPRISHPTTSPDFPPGDLSWLHAIPAIGSKGKPPEQAGPLSQPAKASGRYAGTLVFRFGE